MTKEMIAPSWRPLAEMWSAEQAEHAHIAGYELTAFVIAEDALMGWPRVIGWEIHGGPTLLDLVVKGDAATFEHAKAQAEASLATVLAEAEQGRIERNSGAA
jgi:hypothetical protein